MSSRRKSRTASGIQTRDTFIPRSISYTCSTAAAHFSFPPEPAPADHLGRSSAPRVFREIESAALHQEHQLQHPELQEVQDLLRQGQEVLQRLQKGHRGAEGNKFNFP